MEELNDDYPFQRPDAARCAGLSATSLRKFLSNPFQNCLWAVAPGIILAVGPKPTLA